MRSSKSRSRNKNNRNNNNRSVGNVMNRVFDGSGPEGKVRGTPQQIIDKYTQLASDATLSNDRVAAENFQQHAEHYLRILAIATREQEARREQQEKDQRERQQQRDHQRSDKQDRDQPAGTGEQPDVAAKPAEDTALVETPEAAQDQPRPRRQRRPKPAGASEQGDAPKTDGPAEAAE